MDAVTLRNTIFVIGAIILAIETGLKGTLRLSEGIFRDFLLAKFGILFHWD